MTERIESGGVRGTLHSPDGATRGAIVLAHGASSNSDSKILVGLAAAFAEAGFAALRIDLPFRQSRPAGSPHPSSSQKDRNGIREAADLLRSNGPVYLCGHSYGGRQSSMLAAEDPEVSAGLLLLSYPLHPPGKPEQLRTAHFPQLRNPVVFLHGVRDPFGSPDEMKAATAAIPSKVVLEIFEKAGHELKPVVTKPGLAVDAFLRAYFPGTPAT